MNNKIQNAIKEDEEVQMQEGRLLLQKQIQGHVDQFMNENPERAQKWQSYSRAKAASMGGFSLPEGVKPINSVSDLPWSLISQILFRTACFFIVGIVAVKKITEGKFDYETIFMAIGLVIGYHLCALLPYLALKLCKFLIDKFIELSEVK